MKLFLDPKRKSKYVVRKWLVVGQVFRSCDELKSLLQDEFSDELPELTSDFVVGYFEPPNGAKRWIIDDRDLEAMYKDRASGSKINLWCEPETDEDSDSVSLHSCKKSHKKGTSREAIEQEADGIFIKLKEKHPDLQNPKLRLWAKVFQNGHWDDYENPPPIPLISGTPKQSRRESILLKPLLELLMLYSQH